MPEIGSPFDEPVREEAVGEEQQRLADIASQLLTICGISVTKSEREAVAKTIGIFLRRFPNLRAALKDEALSEDLGKLLRGLFGG